MKRLLLIIVVCLNSFSGILGFASVLDEAYIAMKESRTEHLRRILGNQEHVKFLKEQMYDVAVENGGNILLFAARFGGEAFQLIDENLKPEWSRRGPNGKIPGLGWGQIGPRQLIETGRFDVFATDKDGRTALHHAAVENDLETIELILSKDEESAKRLVNAIDKDGETPLYEAARHGRQNAIQLLLKRGADPKLGRPVLLLFAEAEFENTEDLKAIAQGIDLESRFGYSVNQIERERAENWEAVLLLLNAGASPTQLDPKKHKSFFSVAKQDALSSYVKLAISSPSFRWKDGIQQDVKVLDMLPKYLSRTPGALVNCGMDLNAYAYSPNYLDMVQVGVRMVCTVCSSLAGKTVDGEIPKGMDGENELRSIAVHSCGDAVCGNCYEKWNYEQRQIHLENQQYLQQNPSEPRLACPSCKQEGHSHFLVPFISQRKDKRLERQQEQSPANGSDDASSMPSAKRVRIAQ